MSGDLVKPLIAFVPVFALLAWSAVSFVQARSHWRLVQLAGAFCLMVVVFAHVCEALAILPSMQWGSPTSVGHYVDLSSTVLGLTLFPLGYFGASRRS